MQEIVAPDFLKLKEPKARQTQENNTKVYNNYVTESNNNGTY